MSKDDYHVIVCKILVYLYKRLKGKSKIPPEEYLVSKTKDFPIREDYLIYVLEKMQEQGLIERVSFTRAWGDEIVMMNVDKIRITPDGIEYLRENSVMKKLIYTLPEAASIISLFQI